MSKLGTWSPCRRLPLTWAGVARRLNIGTRYGFTNRATGELIAAWRTNNRVTTKLVQSLPPALWDVAVPGVPRRTIRAIAAHLHNARCGWLKTLGREHGITAPARVDHHQVTQRQLVVALETQWHGDGVSS